MSDTRGSSAEVLTLVEEGTTKSRNDSDASDNENSALEIQPQTVAEKRAAQFKALKARAKSSVHDNLKDVHAEQRRQGIDPKEIAILQRKKADALFNLAKADAADEGEDFERKRAWDWTIEESEKWDKRIEKKKKRAEDVAFQDYRHNAKKVYKRQLQNVKPDLDNYTQEKLKVIKDGQVYETSTGELVAIDKDGNFYADETSQTFIDNKPSKAAVDRLVDDLKKADDVRKRRTKKGDDEDITYINDKNKQFNQKLARYYNKYTTEIRDSFERGTMI